MAAPSASATMASMAAMTPTTCTTAPNEPFYVPTDQQDRCLFDHQKHKLQSELRQFFTRKFSKGTAGTSNFSKRKPSGSRGGAKHKSTKPDVTKCKPFWSLPLRDCSSWTISDDVLRILYEGLEYIERRPFSNVIVIGFAGKSICLIPDSPRENQITWILPHQPSIPRYALGDIFDSIHSMLFESSASKEPYTFASFYSALNPESDIGSLSLFLSPIVQALPANTPVSEQLTADGSCATSSQMIAAAAAGTSNPCTFAQSVSMVVYETMAPLVALLWMDDDFQKVIDVCLRDETSRIESLLLEGTSPWIQNVILCTNDEDNDSDAEESNDLNSDAEPGSATES